MNAYIHFTYCTPAQFRKAQRTSLSLLLTIISSSTKQLQPGGINVNVISIRGSNRCTHKCMGCMWIGSASNTDEYLGNLFTLNTKKAEDLQNFFMEKGRGWCSWRFGEGENTVSLWSFTHFTTKNQKGFHYNACSKYFFCTHLRNCFLMDVSKENIFGNQYAFGTRLITSIVSFENVTFKSLPGPIFILWRNDGCKS